MRVIITGAIGHIGSYTCRSLAYRFPGADIVMIDNMMTQRYPSLFNLPSVGKYKFIEGDVTTMDLEPVLENADVVIHLAAMTDAAGSFGKAEQLEANNYNATKKVAEACLKTNTKLVTLSSTSVYGTQKTVVSEDCSPDELQPQSPYATTKLKEEELVAELCGKGLRAVTLRFGTIFGASEGMRFHTAVNKFCWQAVMGQPITVWSTAYDQKRPYLDLCDAGRAFAHIIEHDISDGRIYNVLTLNATVRDIVDAIRSFIPDLEVKFVDNQIMNQLSYEVSCDRFTETGFVFSGSLRASVGQTISLLKQLNSL